MKDENKNGEGLTDKDKIECCLTFFKEHLKRMNDRRTYEWKFNFALWTAIAAFTGLEAVSKPLKFHSRW